MHLVQILLPLYDPDGRPFGSAMFREVAAELTERFGGVTAYTRAPAEGRWKDEQDREAHDEIVIFESMVERLDLPWWRSYRHGLERRFRQEAVVVRALGIECL